MSSLDSVCKVETGQYVFILWFRKHFLEPLKVNQVPQRLLWGLQNLIIIPCNYCTNFLNSLFRTPSETVNKFRSRVHMDRITLPLLGFWRARRGEEGDSLVSMTDQNRFPLFYLVNNTKRQWFNKCIMSNKMLGSNGDEFVLKGWEKGGESLTPALLWKQR